MNFTLISNIFEPHVRGGYELGCQAIARRLADSGHSVTVLTSPAPGALHKTAGTNGLNVRRIFEPVFEYEDGLSGIFARNPFWHRRVDNAFGGVLPANVIALDEYFSAHPPEVIWLFNPLGLGPVGIVETIARQSARCLIHLMDHIDGGIVAHQHFHFYSGRWRRIKRRLTAISCSVKMRASNEQLGPYRQHHVIYNGFSPREIPEASRPNPPAGPFRFVYFGQFSREKGLPQVVRAFASFLRGKPAMECGLDLFGKGGPAFESELREQIRRENVAGRVRWQGFTPKDELLRRLHEYDAAIMLLNPSEPFGYAPLEAACAGLAVITTADTGIGEIFPPTYPLLVANRDDTSAVKKKMEWCVTHRGELRSVAGQLWTHLAAQCDFDHVTMPAYLKAIEACPVNHPLPGATELLAANATVEFASHFH